MQELAEWTKALEAFEVDQLESGLATSTVAVRVRRLRGMARAVQLGPWAVTSEHLAAWLEAHEGTARSIKSSRTDVHAFYAWAVRAGHITRSPLVAASPVRHRLPARWQDMLDAFERAQAAKLRAASVALRVKHLTRFAADMGERLDPGAVEGGDVDAWLDGIDCAASTRRAYRVSLSAFYRWAVKAGRVAVDPCAQPSRRAQALEVPELWHGEVHAWLRALRGRGHSEETVRARGAQLGRFARELASFPPYAVELDDVLEFFAGKRWAAETRRMHAVALRSFYSWACDTERTTSDPTAKLPTMRAGQVRPRPATDDAYTQALERAKPRERLMLRLAAELGMRRGEVARVHAADVQGGGDRWELLVLGKGNKQRAIPLPRGLATELRNAGAGYLFPGQDAGHLSPRWVGKQVSACLPSGVTMHALRHRFATRAYHLDRDVFTVQQLLGHASPATTQRYVLVSDVSKRSIIDRLSA